MNTPSAEDFTAIDDVLAYVIQPRTLIEICGADRASFLHNLCTNDIRKLELGQGCEAFFTDVKGKVLLHCLLYCEPDAIVLSATGGFAEAILPHLDKYLIREDVTLTDRSEDWSEIFVSGTAAFRFLEKHGVSGLADAPMLSHQTIHIGDLTATLRRVPYVQGDGFVLQVETGKVDAVKDLLAAADATAWDAAVYQLARIQAAFPEYGQDISSDNLPQEIGRDAQAISFVKGCYLGQETVARIDALGHVNRYLVSLRFPSASELPETGTELNVDDKVVGHITSASWSIQPQEVVALGYVRRESIENKSVLSSSVGDATIVDAQG